MTNIYFIRHAESFGNLTRRAYGWYDGIVTPKGYQQISCLKKRFENITIDVVYSSDLIRTCETAKAIFEPKKIKLIKEKAFRELGFGIWEDRPWGELPMQNPEAYNNWVNDPLKFKITDGETYYDVYKRAKNALDRVVAENAGKTVAIVSHGATLRMLMHGITNEDNLFDIAALPWGDNTSVSHFEFKNGKYIEIFKNDNSHLSDMPNVDENMRWVREGGGRNVWFTHPEFPENKEKIRDYHKEAWLEIFGDEPPADRDIDATIKRIHRQNSENIALGICQQGEIGLIELDEDVNLHPMTGHISLLYLKPEYRRMRYGIQLIGHAMSKYYNDGKKHISVRVAEKNKGAYEFYKKYGFYEVKREIQSGFNQIIMIMDIARKDDII